MTIDKPALLLRFTHRFSWSPNCANCLRSRSERLTGNRRDRRKTAIESMACIFAQSSGRRGKILVRRQLTREGEESFTDLSTDFVDISKTPRRGWLLGGEVKVIPEVWLQVLLRRSKKFRPESLLETVCAGPPARLQSPDLAVIYRPGSSPPPRTAASTTRRVSCGASSSMKS